MPCPHLVQRRWFYAVCRSQCPRCEYCCLNYWKQPLQSNFWTYSQNVLGVQNRNRENIAKCVTKQALLQNTINTQTPKGATQAHNKHEMKHTCCTNVNIHRYNAKLMPFQHKLRLQLSINPEIHQLVVYVRTNKEQTSHYFSLNQNAIHFLPASWLALALEALFNIE